MIGEEEPECPSMRKWSGFIFAREPNWVLTILYDRYRRLRHILVHRLQISRCCTLLNESGRREWLWRRRQRRLHRVGIAESRLRHWVVGCVEEVQIELLRFELHLGDLVDDGWIGIEHGWADARWVNVEHIHDYFNTFWMAQIIRVDP